MINTLLYRLAIGAYATGIRAFSLFNPKAKLFLEGRAGLIKKINQSLAGEKRERIWVHCASLGEFEQGRPLIEEIKVTYPQYAIVLTFFSPSGYEVRKNYIGADYVFYLPLDTPSNAAEFLDAVRPKLVLFIKYELWYFYLSGLAQRNIPVFLVSAIFNEQHGFFKWYGSLQRKMLGFFRQIFVQDENSRELLKRIGISEGVAVSGDTRFDRVVKAAGEAVELPIAASFCKGHKIIVAGSTWEADETLLKDVIAQLPEDWKLVLVPHNVDDAHIANIEKQYESLVVKWSDWSEGANKRVLLVNKVGFLMQLYPYADIAYIGGAFGKAGVHNVLEAAVFGKLCLYGPIFHQFIEAGELVASGGAIVVNQPQDIVDATNLVADAFSKHGNAAREYVYSKQGATGIIMKRLKGFLT